MAGPGDWQALQALVQGVTTRWARQALITGMVQAGGAASGSWAPWAAPQRPRSSQDSGAWPALPLGKGPSLPEEAEAGVGK